MPSKKSDQPAISPMNVGDDWWESFTDNCIRNKYVLLVGSGSVLNRANNIEACGDSLRLLFDCTVKHLREKKENIRFSNEVKDFNELSYFIRSIRTHVLETLDSLDFYKQFDEEIEPALWTLLSTRCFRTVLTTTIDPYLEIAMEKVWGKDGFRVLNIYGVENKRDLLRNELAGLNEFNEVQPALYYIFGKADVCKRECRFVLTENDAIDAIRKWFSIERPQNLLRYIQTDGRRVISVGCKFDDWLFRFFWFLLRGSMPNLSLGEFGEIDLSSGEVAVEFTKEDTKLVNYLKRQNVKIFPDDRAFMNFATEKIVAAMNTTSLMSRKLGGVFISYAHEDKNYALQLFYTLEKRGLNVWIDEEKLEPSAEYDTRIENAINQCEVFMTILSSQVMRDLQSGSTRYYQKEWKMAQRRYSVEQKLGDIGQKMKVLPLVIGQYQTRSSYHQELPDCIKKSSVYEALTQSLDSLFQTICKSAK